MDRLTYQQPPLDRNLFNDYSINMNKQLAGETIAIAKRTIKIVELILAGHTTGEILKLLRNTTPIVERSLVDYYQRQLKIK